jgi:peptidoglycan-associated lipoprotein
MSPHPLNRRVSQSVLSQLDHHLWPVLIMIGVAGACSHTQPEAAAPAHPTVAAEQPARRPPPPPEPEAAAAPVDTGKSKELAVYFDFDSSLLRDDARPVLQNVAVMAKNHGKGVRIEGNCDEVGTVEYNLALGEHRAIQAKDYLTRLGIPAGRIKTVSYGSQHPKDPGHDDSAHAENRRDDFILK